MSAGLTAVAAWDVPLLRGAVGTLGAVAERLQPWRARVEGVGRALESAECWSGEAGRAAAATLVEVSAVVTGVTAALGDSREALHRLAAEADTAQQLAAAALAAAAAVPVVLDEAGQLAAPLPPVPPGSSADPATALAQQYEAAADQAAAARRATELAGEALRSAALAAAAAGRAADALAVAGVAGGAVPVDFVDLIGHVGLTGPAPWTPPPAGPARVAEWWAAMSAGRQLDWIATSPGAVGGLDGVPAWARDRANRLLLDRALAEPGAAGHETALAVAAEIVAQESAGRQVQLHLFRPEEELVALTLGDLDAAEAVGLLVPGVGNGPDTLDELADRGAAVAEAAGEAAPGLTVATVLWLGYRPPGNLVAGALPFAARRGGPALDATLDGVAATRAAEPARVTVLAHSYGTVVTDRAADAPGDLAADAVVLLGSPGVDNLGAEWEVPELYESSALNDPVAWLVDVHGWETGNPRVGATSLPTDQATAHGQYFAPDRPTLAAMGEVVAGTADR